MSNWLTSNWFNLLQTLILTAGLVFAGLQLQAQTAALRDTEKVNSANLVLQLSNQLNASQYVGIMTAIEGSNGQLAASTSPLYARGYTYSDIEDYIGNFETVGDLMHDGLIEPTMVDDEMGYDIEKAWCNHDVWSVVEKDRQEDYTPPSVSQYWYGFQLAAQDSLQLDRMTCDEMDKV